MRIQFRNDVRHKIILGRYGILCLPCLGGASWELYVLGIRLKIIISCLIMNYKPNDMCFDSSSSVALEH